MSDFINPANKLFRHMDRLDAIQRGRIQAPVNVEFDLSNRCSLGCNWCHFAYTHTRGPTAGTQDKPIGATSGGDLMSDRLAVRIITELELCGVRSITWTGGGEPTLNPDFARIVKSVMIDQGVYTNGTNLTKENVKAISECCKWAYVSLDAADKDAYIAAKKADKFGAVCRGILDLVQAGTPTVGIGYVVCRDNWRDVIKAWELSQSLGADYIQYRPAILFDPDNPSELAEDTEWVNYALDMLENVSRLPGTIVDLDRFRIYRDWHGQGYETCYWSGMQATITPNGKVWTCVNKREYPGAEIGDLTKEPFVDIWKRRKIAEVDRDCRVSCRGHPANLILNELMKKNEHGNFI